MCRGVCLCIPEGPLYEEGGFSLRRGRADEYPQGAGRICNAPSSRTAALGIGPHKDPMKIYGIATPVTSVTGSQ